MARYRKTALIDAEQFRPGVKPWPEGVEVDADSPTGYGIFTLEQTTRKHEVTPGDWIATGGAGDRWAIKDAIFKATYEAALVTAGQKNRFLAAGFNAREVELIWARCLSGLNGVGGTDPIWLELESAWWELSGQPQKPLDSTS